MALARFLSVFLVFFEVTFVISAESSLNQNENVVYSRWVRRRPVAHHKNVYIDEVREVFHTRRRPPPFAFLNDETLTRFVRCDYDPSLPDCDESGVRTTSVKPERTSTFGTTTPTRSTTTTSKTMGPSPTSTARSTWIHTTRTTVRTPWIDAPTTTSATSTTSTTPPTTSTTTTPTPTPIPESHEAPTTEELPLLPDIEGDNEDDYTEDEDSPTSNNEEEERKQNFDYLNYDNKAVEEAAEEEDYLTEDNEVEEADGDSDIAEVAALTQETTTAKSKPLFSWF